jgi:hypothetical protein
LTIYTFQMTPARNNIVVRNDPGNPAYVQFLQGSTVLQEINLANFSGLRVLCDSGTDTLTVDYRYGVPLPSGGLDYEGGIGLDTLNVNEHPTAAHGFTLGPYFVQRSDSAPITFPTGLDVVNVNGGSGNSYDIVTGTLATCRTTINTGNGRDTVNVGGAAGTLLNYGPLTVNGGTGLDTLLVDDEYTTTGQAFTLGAYSVQRSGLAPITFPTGLDVVTVTGGRGNNSYTVANTLASCATTVNTGSVGASTVTVGDGGNTLHNNGPVTVNGVIGTRLNVNDQGTPSAETYTVTATSVSRTGGVAPITYSGIQSLAVNAGRAAETVNVQGTNAYTATTVNSGAGSDTVNVGAGGRLQGIVGAVTVNGGGGTRLNVNDQGTTTRETYTVTPASVSRTGGVAPLTYGNLQSLAVNPGQPVETVNVQGTAAGTATTVNGGAGSDTVTIGAGGSAQAIRGAVTVVGRDDNLTVDDSADTGNRSVTISSGGITGLAPAALNFSVFDVSFLTVNGGSGNNNYTVTATPAYLGMTLNAGPGTDTVNVGDGSLSGINAPLTVHGGGNTGLNVNDQGTSTSQTYTVTNNSVRRTGLAVPITYSNLQSLAVNAGMAVETVNVQGTAAGTATTINAGAGSAAVNIGAGGSVQGIQGAVTLSSGPDQDVLNVDDSADTGNRTATVSAGGITGLAPAAINFTSSSVRTLTVLGGSGNNTYTASNTPAFDGMALNTGSGADAVDVQGASAPLAINAQGGGGDDVVNLGLSNSLAGITGAVTLLSNSGSFHVNINDAADAVGHDVFLDAGALTGLAPAPIFFGAASVNTLTVTGGAFTIYTVTGSPAYLGTTLNADSGTTDVHVQASPYPLTINSASGSGGSAIVLGDAVNTLAGITALVTVNAAATDFLVLNDQATAGARTYTVTPTTVAWGGPTVRYSGLAGLAVMGGAGGNTFDLSAGTSASAVVYVIGGGGSNSLLGSAAGNIWAIEGADGGSLTGAAYPSPVSFGRVGSLTAGSGGDTFRFADGATLSGTLTGGGFDTLDYSAYSSSVIVDLQTGFATGVGGSISGIGTVYGGTGNGGLGAYNLLIGATTGGNTLNGGFGRRNILVAGGGPSTLNAGDQEDLLIGGTTAYDTEAGLVSWQQIAAYWAGTDDYATRVTNLTTAGSGVPLLDATTVTGNGGGNALYGNGALALLYSDGLDSISGFDPASQTVTIAP